MKTVVAVVLRLDELIESGFLATRSDSDVVVLNGMKMPSGRAYTGVIIPITTVRRNQLNKIAKQRTGRRQTDRAVCPEVPLERDLTRPFEEAMRRPIHQATPVPEELCDRPRRNRVQRVLSNSGFESPTRRAQTRPAVLRSGAAGDDDVSGNHAKNNGSIKGMMMSPVKRPRSSPASC